MPRRRRKDPDDAPIDGDPQFDTIYNRDPSKQYAGVSIEDMPRLLNRGFTRTIASADGPRAAYGVPAEDGSQILINGQLVLMEAPKEIAEAAQKKGEKEFARRAQGLRQSINDHVRANPGSEYRNKQNYSSAG